MNILGINYIFHDTSACIVSDGRLVVAIEEERLTREKHTQKFPVASIARCLEIAGLEPRDIDHVAVSVSPGKNEADKLFFASRIDNGPAPFIDYEFHRLRERHLAFWAWYNGFTAAAPNRSPRVHFVDHHLAHVAGSYFVSPWEKAALLSVDGWGEWTTTWLGEADGFDVRVFKESVFPNSLGVFYSAATEFCGFKPNYDEGKTMGLAPTGDPERYYREVSGMVKVDSDGDLEIDLSWFGFQTLSGRLCGPKFHQRFGRPRLDGEEIRENHRDVAAAFQRVLEESLIALCRVLEKRTRADHLVLAGGVALNSVANGRLLRETRFEDVYVMPGAGDNGTCIGAAYQVYNGTLGQTNRMVHDDPYVGTGYCNDSIEAVLRASKLNYRRSVHVCRETAKMLRDGKILGWFQGRMEFGPRALGNRSILADPSIEGMKDKINAEVKHREAFRPFAPSVPAEDSSAYFDIDVDTPFMLKVCNVRSCKRDLVPAVVHVDGTARVQTVSSGVNPRYHALLREFGRLSEHPVVLNTSFNVMGEPIVENPEQALRCFFSTGLDGLVLGDFVIEK